ncbi:hypothetical protein GGX14DRAFT_634450 [Mycena pura]|uniref:C2H2-type domain-containing protein n=1 Tax=Mycena pura TaxID=153505 RepID=A0AAD6VC16_9AGAR|nr:hypothetical protein GGX14DRAFT_634450 [Mycena pura]
MSHPIALPAAAHSPDYQMGSYMGSYDDGAFNPASYTRHFLGSPISWRAGSFGAQFVPSQSPTAMLVGSFDRSKSPQDSSILNAWNVFDRQGELCRNYTCCGQHLPDLHALLEHFEDVHIIVKDRSQPPSIQIPFNPQINPPDAAPIVSQAPQPQYTTPFDTDDMDLGLDYEDASPPPPSTAPTSAGTSRAPSPSPSPSGTQRPALNIALTGVGVGFPFREGVHTPLSASGRAPFSAFARYNSAENSPGGAQDGAEYSPDVGSVAPALVFGTDEEPQGEAPPSTGTSSATVAPVRPVKASKRHAPSSRSSSDPPSRVPTPASAGASSTNTPANTSPSANSNANANATAGAATPATILLPQKPFRCPKPHCSKSYKQANGLKYHLTHGSCSYGPAKDVEAVRALLERKRANANANANATAAPVAEEDDSASASPPTPNAAQASNATSAPGLSQAEINEVEARMRPFACGVGDCSRRYKNMNGLRYHYQHSGDHGAVGLGLLAGGLHGCLKGNTNAAVATAAATSAADAGNATAPAAGGAKAKGATYAWGSTLLPHIQAVATTSKTAKGKTEATPFTPPATSTPTAPTSATATFAITPQTVTTQAQTAPAFSQNPEYLAQLQRAQYAQYQHAVASGWYAATTPQPPTQPVDVSMGGCEHPLHFSFVDRHRSCGGRATSYKKYLLFIIYAAYLHLSLNLPSDLLCPIHHAEFLVRTCAVALLIPRLPPHPLISGRACTPSAAPPSFLPMYMLSL